jgi:hypothetical protein
MKSQIHELQKNNYKIVSKKLALILVIAIASFSCRNAEKEAAMQAERQQAIVDSMKIVEAEAAKQRTIDSMKAVAAQQQAAAQRPIVVNNTAAAPTAEQKRKGWSGAAKGAVIGAGVGAVTGAIIDKDKPGRGAVIGGLAGGGVGAGTGAIIDSEKKKKAAQK